MSDLDKTGRAGGQDGRANNCFVCGIDNPIGLKVEFLLLDDVMANWAWLQGKKCFTAKADIRYRQELPIGTEVLLEGRCTKLRGRLAQMEGVITRKDDRSIVAESTGSFMMSST